MSLNEGGRKRGAKTRDEENEGSPIVRKLHFSDQNITRARPTMLERCWMGRDENEIGPL